MKTRALLLLPLLATACGAADQATADPAAVDEGAVEIATGSTTKVMSGLDEKGRVGSFTFELITKDGKRAAVVHAQRGDLKADVGCSQIENLQENESEDEIITLCEEQIRPGSEYVSVYFRHRPKSRRWSYDVIASHPEKLTAHQRELYELFTGSPVKSPPPPPEYAAASHREEADKLSLKSAVRGTDPFADPIALARELHPAFRGALGAKAKDARAGGVEYPVEKLTWFSNFDTMIYAINTQGRDAEGRWHNGVSHEVPVTQSPTTLASPETIVATLEREFETL